jgi:GNAT superfamily N-acetyltransferase
VNPIFEPLGKSHDRAAFSCGVEALDRYLKHQARQDARNHVAVPFVARYDNSTRIIGYYTLSAFTIEATERAAKLIKHLPRYEQLPAVLIGRLAVDRDFAGQGFGTLLLMDALHRSLEQSQHMGAMAVVVDAKDDQARSFYEHRDFKRLLDHEYRLYLPMKTIQQLF